MRLVQIERVAVALYGRSVEQRIAFDLLFGRDIGIIGRRHRQVGAGFVCWGRSCLMWMRISPLYGNDRLTPCCDVL